MSLDELRTTLRDHAGEVDPQVDPVPAVRARIRRRARAKTAVLAGVVVAAVVAAATVLPGVLPRRNALPAQRPSPAPTATATLKTSVFKVGFPTRVNGDPLVASYVGPKGPSTGTFTFTATGHAISLRPVCKLPRWVFGQTTLQPPMLAVWIDGRPVIEANCSVFAASTEEMLLPRTLPVVAGRSVSVKLSVVLGGAGVFVNNSGVSSVPSGNQHLVRRHVSGAQLALGIYDHTGPSQTKAGITLPVLYGTPGHELHLRSFVTQPLTNKVRDLRATLPAASHSIVVVSGGGHGQGNVSTTIRGPHGDSTGGTAGAVSFDPLPASKRRAVVVHAGHGVTGTLVFAYYSK